MDTPVIYDPVLPYVGSIYGGRFTPGKLIKIHGIVPATAYSFNLQLQCGPNTIPRDDVAVQIAVRLAEGYISLNSLQNGIWGEEQRGASIPLKRSEEFEIIIVCEPNQYKVTIGQNVYEFPQRIRYDRITHLAIDGDVSIIRIAYESAAASGIRTGVGLGNRNAPPLATSETEFGDLEMINVNTMSGNLGGQPMAESGVSELPTYEKAVQANQGATAYNAPVTGASYPTGYPAYPTGPSYPTQPPAFVPNAYPPLAPPQRPPSFFRNLNEKPMWMKCLLGVGIVFVVVSIACIKVFVRFSIKDD